MIFITHVLAGILFASYFSNNKIAIAIAALFAALPDIDMVKSKAGRNLQPFSTLAAFFFRHRGFLHTVIFTAIVYFAVNYLVSAPIAAAATMGYSSHLLLDAVTKEGIRPLWPLSNFKIRGFIKTGGFLEKIVLATLAILLLTRLKFT